MKKKSQELLIFRKYVFNDHDKPEFIKVLLDTIKDKNYDIVVGCRDFEEIKHFSNLKKKLQKLGSWVVRIISGQKITDASSGFRVYSKKAINKIKCTSKFWR